MSPTALFLSAPWCRGRAARLLASLLHASHTVEGLVESEHAGEQLPCRNQFEIDFVASWAQRALHATFRRTNSRWDLFHALPTPVQALAGQELSTVAKGSGPPLSSFPQLAWKLRLSPGCGSASMKSTTGLCAENRFSGAGRCRSFIYCPFATVTASHRTATFSIRATASIRFSSELA